MNVLHRYTTALALGLQIICLGTACHESHGAVGDTQEACERRYGKVYQRSGESFVEFRKARQDTNETLQIVVHFANGKAVKVRYKMLHGDGTSGRSALLRREDIKDFLRVNGRGEGWSLVDTATGIYNSVWRNEALKLQAMLLAGSFDSYLEIVADEHAQ